MFPANDHPTDEQLQAYAREKMSAPDGPSIADHLDTCRVCDDRVIELEATANVPASEGIAPVILKGSLIDSLLFDLVPCQRISDEERPTIPGYEIIGELGRGGMGVVYKAWSGRFKGVAVKMIRPGTAPDSPDALAAFQAEAEQARAAWDSALARGDASPPFVRVYEIGDVDGAQYYSMELAVAGTLADRLDQLMESPRHASEMLRAIARAVDAEHQRGVFHRDLKPKNILLRIKPGRARPGDMKAVPLDDLEPMVSDYGVSKASGVDGGTKSGDLKGTPQYSAPELIRNGSAQADRRSEVFSLGVILYEMITRSLPFVARAPVAVLEAIDRGGPTWPRRVAPQTPRELEAICLKCLEANPKNRYQSAGTLAEDLDRFLEGNPDDPVRARHPSPVRQALAWRRRHPRVAGSIAFMSLAIVGLLGWLYGVSSNLAATQAVLEGERKMGHEATVAAARLAARRADWSTALRLYRQAIEDRTTDALTLRVERLWGFLAVNDMTSLADEFRSLDGRADLGRLAAEVALAQGAYELCYSGSQSQGLEKVRNALAHRDDLVFSPADPLFAEALAETRPTFVVETLREAVQVDHLHLPANSSLLVALVATGDLEGARAQGRRMETDFPESVLPELIFAMIDLIEGDRVGMRGHLDRLSRRIGAGKTAEVDQLRRYCEDLFDLLEVFGDIDDIKATPNPNSLDKRGPFTSKILQVQGKAAIAFRPFGFPVPTVGILFRSVDSVFQAYLDSSPGAEDSYRRLVRLGEENPEALIQALAAANRLSAVIGPINSADLPRVREILDEMIRTADRAAKAPTLVPNTPTRYQALVLGAIADVTMLKITPNAGPACGRRLRDRLHELVVYGRRWDSRPEVAKRWPGWRSDALDLFLKMIAIPMTREQARDWNLDDAEGRQAFQHRRQAIIKIGQNLVDDWLEEEPDSINARRWRDELSDALKKSGLHPEKIPQNGDKFP